MWHNVKYGKFIAAIINFLIVGFVLFMIVKTMNRIQKKADEKTKMDPVVPVPTNEEKLLTEIRDLLKK
jgi:large conductance mechanosensitive channel